MLNKAGGHYFLGATTFGQVHVTASALCTTESLMRMNILKVCVLQGLMELMQLLL